MSFLDVEASRENSKFVITRKPTFSGVYIHFESFLRSTHKFGMLYALVYRCFTLCSDLTNFHREFVTLKEIYQRNGYTKSFIDKCFKKFLDRLHIIKTTLATVEKMPLCLVLPYLGLISSQVRTKIRNAIKSTLICCRLQVIFKSKRKPSNMLKLKDHGLYHLVSGIAY